MSQLSKHNTDNKKWLRWTWFRTVIPYISVPLLVVTSFAWGVQWYEIVLFLSTVVLSGVGFSVGLHRYFTHHSFKTSAPVRAILGVLGLMGSHLTIQEYVAVHRAHHANPDEEGDPHSPLHTPYESAGSLRRLLYAHTVWLFNPHLDPVGKVNKYATDYRDDQLVSLLDTLHMHIFFLSLIVPGIIVGAIENHWHGFVSGILWGGLFRVFTTDQAECWGRGISHYYGSTDMFARGSSKNHWIAYITMGEWHNNHHAFPNSAKHGFKWWQLDVGYLLIAFMSVTRLVWDVKHISKQRIQEKEIRPVELSSNE